MLLLYFSGFWVYSSIVWGFNLLISLIKHFYFFQVYAPTTLAPARDFWTLRYTSSLEDGSLVVIIVAVYLFAIYLLVTFVNNELWSTDLM